MNEFPENPTEESLPQEEYSKLRESAEKILMGWKNKGYDCIGYNGKNVYPTHLNEIGNVDTYFTLDYIDTFEDKIGEPKPFKKALGTMVESMIDGWRYEAEQPYKLPN